MDIQHWHHLQADAALVALEVGSEGLSEIEARRRLDEHGPNRLTPPRRRGVLLRLLSQFNNVLIHVLLGAALVTALLGHRVDSGVILGVVLINAVIGFLQEGKAERSLDALRNMLSLHAVVVRAGRREEIAAEELVPGDIVVLSSGDKVPADLRLLATRNLRIEEAILSGESEPVEKDPAAVAEQALLGDRRSMAYSGTLVVFGQGRGVVVATGDGTEIGRIGRLLAAVETVETPLLRQMAVFGRWLTAGILVLAAATLVFGILVHGEPAGEMFIAAVGLAVAAIPEGLPAIMTITLAIGVQRMAGRNAIIRRMPAVETLGALSTICSDKTGTLTRNEMTVQKLVSAERTIEVSGVGYAPHGGFMVDGEELDPATLVDIAHVALLCNDATLREQDGDWKLDGDPTEGALLTLALKAGFDPHQVIAMLPRLDAIPFESEHRFMASLHHDHSGHVFVLVKGAPERVIAMCARQRQQGVDVPIRAGFWHQQVEHLAGQGYRVLALASAPMPREQRTLDFGDVDGGLTLLALAAIMDPPRAEAIRAVALCQGAGIRVKMITGDHAITAAAIARTMGLTRAERVLTGSEIEHLDDATLQTLVGEVDVFARASPEHKLRLVQALQAAGEVVGMTGDGVNDAPALKRADVGIAMGHKGTEAAKEASAMVLTDDNFASIAAAVEEGRTVYDNLRKAVVYVLPTSSAQAAMVLIAVLFDLTLPITPVQILWVNMVIAVTLSIAIAFERPEPGLMARQPRRRDAALVNGFMLWRILFVMLLLVATSFTLFLWEQQRHQSLALARTAAVNTLVMGQIFYLFNCRQLHGCILSAQGLFGNHHALLAVGGLVALQLAFSYLPLGQDLFGTAALDASSWLAICASGVFVLMAVEIEKWLWRSRHAR